MNKIQKSILPALGVISVLLSYVACAPKTLPPELKPSYTKVEILTRIQELQNTTIGVYDSTPRGITKERADMVVKFCMSSANVVQASNAGWQTIIKTSWAEFKKNFAPNPETVEPGLKLAFSLVDAALTGLQ